MADDPHQCQDKYVLRLPDGMRDEIKAAAAANSRSMNAEIVHRLKQEGPAEGATSPSHGPTNHHQEISMNKPTDTTAGAGPASGEASAEAAFAVIVECCRELYHHAMRTRIMATETAYCLEEGIRNEGDDKPYTLNHDRGDAAVLLANETEDGMRKIARIVERLDVARMTYARRAGL